MSELHDLELLITSRVPITVIESLEEERVLELFTRLALRRQTPAFRWSVTEGFSRLEVEMGKQPHTADPTQALKQIKVAPTAGIYVLLDFHPYLDNPVHVRLIKEIAQGYEKVPRTLVFVSHAFEIPDEIRHLTARFELALPDRDALIGMIREEARLWQQQNGNRRLPADRKAIERLSKQLLGTIAADARRLIRNAIHDDGAITLSDLPRVMEAKYELMRRDGVISFEYDTARFSDIAGLDHLKAWLDQRRSAFEGGGTLDKPKGIMLLGVQGCGKSLAAKAVAGRFGLPLLRLDFGALYNKYYGETERNLRNALKTAESMAPTVLWIDEIEKGIASDSSDEGITQRVLGTLLTWMAERDNGVFIVATSNDIERLPPELVRKGRLDEVFFVDLPDEATRRQIFELHLRKRNIAPHKLDLDTLAATAEGFSGAEIEQTVVAALYAAQAQDAPLDTPHLLEELARTRPLSILMAEKIGYLRQWAAERTVPAQ